MDLANQTADVSADKQLIVVECAVIKYLRLCAELDMLFHLLVVLQVNIDLHPVCNVHHLLMVLEIPVVDHCEDMEIPFK